MKPQKEKRMLILSMCIFATIGLLRRSIPYSSGFVAMIRGFVGAAFLLAVVLLRGGKPDFRAIWQNALVLALSGGALGLNWIFLFEAYNHTTVATATLCYYLAPILVILVSPIVLKEKLTGKKLCCAAVSLIGIILVSGVGEAQLSGIQDGKGILFGLAAAALYAAVMLLNRKLVNIGPYDKTISQLLLAAVILLPYVCFTENVSDISLAPLPLLLLITAGIVHTGVAYWLYFGAIGSLSAQTTALFSYIDPIGAVLLSMLILKEPMSPAAAIGAVLILGAAIYSEKA